MQAVQLVHRKFQLLAVRDDGADERQQVLPHGAQLHARAAAVQQLHPPFPLKILYHPADGGLGVAHLFRGKAEAPKLHGFQERSVLLQAHCGRSFHEHFLCII